VRIAPGRADLVTMNAVGSRTLLVTARAERYVAPSRRSVEISGSGIATDPARGMGVTPVHLVAADAVFDVTGVARRRLVTAETARRIDLRLDGMAHEEISTVHEVPFDRLGMPLLDGETLRDVVASVAVDLRVTRLTKQLFFDRLPPVVSNEISLVLEERARHETPEILLLVAWRALAPLPFRLVLVTRQAFFHWRNVRSVLLDHARVARHALTADFGEREVAIVVELDFSVLPLWNPGEHAAHFFSLVPVTAIAE